MVEAVQLHKCPTILVGEHGDGVGVRDPVFRPLVAGLCTMWGPKQRICDRFQSRLPALVHLLHIFGLFTLVTVLRF